MFVLTGHESEISDNSVRFTTDGQMLISADELGVIRVWDIPGQCLKSALVGHKKCVCGLTPIPGTPLIASGGWDKKVCIWDLTAQQRLRTFKPGGSIIALAASPDGRTLSAVGGNWLWSADQDGNGAWLWDTKTWKRKPVVGTHSTQIGTVCFSLDGKQIITGAADRFCRIWDVESGDRLASLTHTAWIQGLAIADGKLAVAAGRRVLLWSLPTEKEPARLLTTLTGYRGTTLTVAFSPDGRLLATGGKDGLVRIWDVEADSWHRVYRWKIGRIHAVTFAPDGLTIAAGGDRDIVVWDVE